MSTATKRKSARKLTLNGLSREMSRLRARVEEIENLLPESLREHVTQFPIAAVLLGLGVGIWLGMKKGNEVLAAGTSMVTAAAMSNVSQAMERFGAGSDKA